MAEEPLRISAALMIPAAELDVRATRSGGAGGQHVNKTATRVEVVWNVRTSAALTTAQRERLLEKLHNRLSAAGELRVVASELRSQHRNRERALQRLAEMVRRGLVVPRRRIRTAIPAAAREARLDAKKHRSRQKARRRMTDE